MTNLVELALPCRLVKRQNFICFSESQPRRHISFINLCWSTRQNNDSRIIITIKLEMQTSLPPCCKRNSWLFLLCLSKILNSAPDKVPLGKSSIDEQSKVTTSLRGKRWLWNSCHLDIVIYLINSCYLQVVDKMGKGEEVFRMRCIPKC